jgi:hypothetical protein
MVSQDFTTRDFYTEKAYADAEKQRKKGRQMSEREMAYADAETLRSHMPEPHQDAEPAEDTAEGTAEASIMDHFCNCRWRHMAFLQKFIEACYAGQSLSDFNITHKEAEELFDVVNSILERRSRYEKNTHIKAVEAAALYFRALKRDGKHSEKDIEEVNNYLIDKGIGLSILGNPDDPVFTYGEANKRWEKR